jgi:hypothetical protein
MTKMKQKKRASCALFREEALSLLNVDPAQQTSVTPILIRLGSPHVVNPKKKK